MSSDQHARVSELFLQAVELDGTAQRQFLDRACAGHPELRSRVELLLKHDTDLPEILQGGVITLETSDLQPDRIGPYEIVERLGEGGMGLVYRARQSEPIARDVAIKLIRGEFISDEASARFDTERRTLARMSHPNVARVHDAGTTQQGQPYLVMELVEGERITRFCDRQRLQVDDRLALFSEVCLGVQHAHQKAVLHRDIKPSNVLVTIVDGRPVPKIIDFGVAKPLDRERGATSTRIGQLVGTLEYMSPEQAALDEGEIDTRSDVYGLAALLYELLVGEPPFAAHGLNRKSLDEVRRVILHVDPPRPSERVGSLRLTDETTLASEIDRTRYRRLLKGDLDWIVMKGLAKEPARRYGSPAELRDDIGRYLRHEPVRARPPGNFYQLFKFVSRHRLAVGFAAIVAMLLIGFGVTLTLQTFRIAAERNRAESAVEAVSMAMAYIVGMLDPKESDAARRRALDEFGGEDPVEMMERIGSRAAISRESSRIALDGAEHFQESVLELRRKRLGEIHPDTLRAKVIMGRVYQQSGRLAEAEQLIFEAFDQMQRSEDVEPGDLISARTWLASVYLDQQRHDQVQSLLEHAIPSMRNGRVYSNEGLVSLYNLACAFASQGDLDTAIHYFRESMEHGFAYEATKDPQLGALRGDPRFLAMMDVDGYIRHLWRATDAAGVGDRSLALDSLRSAVKGGLTSADEILFGVAFLPYLQDPEFRMLLEDIDSESGRAPESLLLLPPDPVTK